MTVDADPLGRDLQMRLVVRPVRRCRALIKESIMRVTDVLPLVPVTCTDG